MSHKLQGKLQTFSLNVDDPNAGWKYLNLNTNFGTIRNFFQVDVYNPLKKTGEQRVGKRAHRAKINKALLNDDYTPASFNGCITDLSVVDIDEQGNVSIPLIESQKNVIVDGGTRLSVLEEIRSQGGKWERLVDNLPIPLIIYLDPEKRKRSFVNLNNGTHISKSHILGMLIDNGRLPEEKLNILSRAKSIAELFQTDENSPLRDKIQFGHTGDGSLALSVICTDHAKNAIGSLFGTVKILDILEKDAQWFVDFFGAMYREIEHNTECTKTKKLLALPPDGPKGVIHNWLSVVNTTAYYLYLREQVDQPCTFVENKDHILDCIRVYDYLVAGDISHIRRKGLTLGYAQKLFSGMDEDPIFDEICGFSYGIPIPLYINTSWSSFGVDDPGKALKKTTKGNKSKVVTEGVETCKVDSDSTLDWEDE